MEHLLFTHRTSINFLGIFLQFSFKFVEKKTKLTMSVGKLFHGSTTLNVKQYLSPFIGLLHRGTKKFVLMVSSSA